MILMCVLMALSNSSHVASGPCIKKKLVVSGQIRVVPDLCCFLARRLVELVGGV